MDEAKPPEDAPPVPAEPAAQAAEDLLSFERLTDDFEDIQRALMRRRPSPGQTDPKT